MTHTERRLRVMSRAALYGSMLHKHRLKRRHFVAGQAFLIALVIASSAVLQVYFDIKPPKTEINQRALKLLNDSRDDAKQYLKQDPKTQGFSFEVPKSEGSEDASTHTGRVADAYSASFPKDVKEGVSVTDTNTQIVFNMAPKFTTSTAHKTEDNRIVYTRGSTQLVYTLQYNGVKEDIIIPDFQGDSLEYEFELRLPSGVEARLDEEGNVGLYSGDSTLYGNISYGSDADRAKMDLAREKSSKTNLVATIPYPVVKDASGKEHNDLAKFLLGEKRSEKRETASENQNLPAEVKQQLASQTTQNIYDVSIHSEGLKNLPYPISIDPTFKITSAGDFTGVNYEEGTELDSTNNLIKRSNLSGGVIASRQGLNNMSDVLREPGMAVYNGALYKVGGCKRVTANAGVCDTNVTQVDYATINSNGTINAWTNTGSSLPVGSGSLQVAVYNGYMYIHGAAFQTPSYARIGTDRALYKANGTKGWDTGSVPAQNTFLAGFVASKGFLYIIDGTTVGGIAQYARLNGDGSIGTWATTSSMNTDSQEINTTTYNGYIYVVSGYNTTKVQYAKINDDGTLSAWILTTAYPNVIWAHRFVALKGYMYVFGGRNETAGLVVSAIQYAQINADGSLGTWQVNTVTMSFARFRIGLATDGTYIFTAGGCTNGTSSSCNASTDVSTVESYSIKPTGEVNDSAFTNDTDTFASASYYHTTVVYNSYLYVIGGCTATDCGTVLSSVRYAPLNADGSIGAFTTDTDTLAQSRFAHASFAYNGRIYVVGGCEATSSGVCSQFKNNTYYSTLDASGNPGAWSNDATDPFTTARYGLAAVEYNGFAYVIGGCSAGACSTYLSDVQVATINSDGTLGAFSAEDSFTTGRFMHSASAYNGYLYLGGGYSGSFQSDTQYTPIASSGTISAWSTDTGDFSTARFGHNLVIDKGYAYVIGGCSALTAGRCLTFESGVQYAQINNDGTLGTWTTTQSIAVGRFGAGVIINGGYIRVIGGCTAAGSGTTIFSCTAINNQVQYQAINNGGSGIVSAWTEDDTSGIGLRRYHQMAAYNGYLYVLGGCTATNCSLTGNQTAGVQYVAINSDGTLGTWASTTNLPTDRMAMSVTILNGFMYTIGGERRTGAGNTLESFNTVHYTTFNSNGTINAWTAATATPGGMVTGGITAHKGNIYVDFGTIHKFATPTSGGDITSWTSLTNSPSGDRYTAALVGYGDYLYRVGGCVHGQNCDATFTLNTIDRVQLATSGNTAAAWQTLGTRLPFSKVTDGRAFVLNGYMYVTPNQSGAGWGGAGAVSYYAPLIAGGDLGSWQATVALSPVRQTASSILYNGVLYLTGGTDNTSVFSNTYYAALQSIPRKGSFSRLFNFEAGVKPTKLITRGTKKTGSLTQFSYKTGNNTSIALDNTGSNTDIGYNGANALSFVLGANRTLSQYLWIRYTIDDSQSAVFPDSGNESAITDFDLYYHANSARRLRGGRTFTNGADRGLDVQP